MAQLTITMTPTQLILELEARGLKLKIREGQLYGSKGFTDADRELVAKNKPALVALLTGRCPVCDGFLKERIDPDHVSWLECSTDLTHFGERIGRIEFRPCPGDECKERIRLVDGRGWCPNHKMAIREVG